MTNLTKILVSTAVVAGVSALVAVVAEEEKKEEKVVIKDAKGNEKVVVTAESNVKVDKNGEIVEEKPGLIKRIKKYVTKKVIKFLAFVALNQQKIEAVCTVIGLGSAALGIANAIRDFKNGNDMQKKINEMDNKLNHFYEVYDYNRIVDNNNAKAISKQIYDCHHAEVSNQKLMLTCLEALSDTTLSEEDNKVLLKALDDISKEYVSSKMEKTA